MNRIASMIAAACAPLSLLFSIHLLPGQALAQGLAPASLTTEIGSYELAGETYPADLGTLTVPENRTDPNSRIIELPLIRIHATGDDPAEAIFVLAGGPGDPNIAWQQDSTLVGLLEHHDIVMVGYRGIDGSVSLDAPEVTEIYRTFTENPLSSENLERLGQAYYAAFQRLQGEGVDMSTPSQFVYDPMEFRPDVTFQQMARDFVAQAAPPEVPLEARLQATLNGWREANDIVGVTLAVAAPELGVIELASGLADVAAGTAMTPDDPLLIASMTKTYVATVVLQLVDEGALTLDDTLSRWFPDFPNADVITIRQLLSHTSGAADYMSPENRVSFATTALDRAASDWPGWTPEDLLEVAVGMESLFEPGTSFVYSNSNTVLLGRIVELLTGNPLHVELRGRLFEPLALERTFFAGAEAIPGGWGPGYSTEFAGLFGVSEPPAVLEERIVTLISTSAWASGGLVATAGDVVRFEQALFAGELLEAATLAEMVAPSPIIDTFVAGVGGPPDIGGGLGVFMYPFPTPIGTGIGHDGGEPGFRSIMLTFPEHGISVAVLVNDGRPNFNIFPRGDDVDALVSEVVRVTLEGVTGTEISLEGAATGDNVYQDPRGRFSLPLIGSWTQVETDGSYARFALAQPPVELSLVTAATGDLDAGIDAALQQVGLDPATLTLTSAGTSLGLWNVYFYAAPDEQGAAVLAQVNNDTTYVIIGSGREEVVARGEPPGDVLDTIEGFSFAGVATALPSTVEEFEAYLNTFVGEKPPGLSIVISAGGDVVYANGFGLADGPLGLPATPDTVYQWGSMAKMMTATAIMQLVDRDLIDLDAPVVEYLEYFPAEHGITVRQLLTHSAGLPEADVGYKYFSLDGEPLPDPDLAAREYAATFTGPIFEPGTTSAYANPHLLFLGQIVAEVSGQPYNDYAREHILTPLGMINTDFTYSNEVMIANAASHAVPAAQRDSIVIAVNQFWESGNAADVFRESDGTYAWQNRYDMLAAWGGLKGPPTEALRFVQMHLNGGELDGVRILSPEAAASMREVQLSTSGEPLEFTLGWRVDEAADHPYVEHAGGGIGIRDLMRLYPSDGVAIVMMSNAAGYDDAAVVDAAANVVFSLLAGPAPGPAAEAFTPPITDADGNTLPDSIATLEQVTLGGVEQWIMIRGADTSKPVLLVLHGGPGFAMTPWVELYQRPALEENFVVVHWDQRGAGKSYSPDLSADDMHVANLVSDTLELTDLLRDFFGQDRIFLTGHSWGSALGFLAVMENPEPYHAYIASGEAAHWNRRQLMSYEWVLEQARNAGDSEVIEALEGLEPFDPTSVEHVAAKNQFLDRYRGGDYYTEGLWDAYLAYALEGQSPAYTEAEIEGYVPGLQFSSQTLGAEVHKADYNLFQDFPESSIPIHFLAGRHDHQTPGELAEEYFVFLEAPAKSFTWFEDSGHTLMFDEPDRWAEELIRIANETLGW